MDQKEKEYLINRVRMIQADVELLLWQLNNDFKVAVNEKKEERSKPPFTGQKGICDKKCDEKDILDLSTFQDKKFQCKRCGMLVEEK